MGYEIYVSIFNYFIIIVFGSNSECFVDHIIRNKQLRAHLVSETSDASSDFKISTDSELGRLKQDILVSSTISKQYACDLYFNSELLHDTCYLLILHRR